MIKILLVVMLAGCASNKAAKRPYHNERYLVESAVAVQGGDQYLVKLKGIKRPMFLPPIPGYNNLKKDCTVTIINLRK